MHIIRISYFIRHKGKCEVIINVMLDCAIYIFFN